MAKLSETEKKEGEMNRCFFNYIFIAFVFILTATATYAGEQSHGDRFAIAIERGDLDAVKALVEGGARADTIIDYGEHKITPLMKACWEGQGEIVVYLLDSGAKVNATDEAGQTALFSAITQDKVELVKLLIGRGAKVNIRDVRQFAPITLAASMGNGPMVEALAAAGADLNVETYGLTPLMFAVSSKKMDMIRLLVKLGAPVNYASKGGDAGSTALFSSIYSGDAEMVRALIELKADVNVKTKSGNTPLKAARQGDQEDIIAILKEAGAKK
jgi:ankyrin repeat protein